MVTYLTNTTWAKKINIGDINICRNICKRYGKKYYLATFFLPQNERYATWVLYAFFRIADEIVDTEQSDPQDAKSKLENLYQTWKNIYEIHEYDNQDYTNIILSLTKEVVLAYKIPFEYSESFFKAMLSDTEKKRYESYAELKEYMYGSAAVVGLMMAHVIGYDDAGREQAILLGEAMQMTNFLRDIREDFVLRDRIYLPQDDMQKHNISDADISNFCHSREINSYFEEYMRVEIQKNREQYKKANSGIIYLNKRGQLGVYIASRLYEKILDKIEENKYNVFEKRVSVNKREKIIILLSSIWNQQIKK
jgi:15-cis-phytoene synthase